MTERTLQLARGVARGNARTAARIVAAAAATALAAQAAIPVPGTPVPLALAPLAVVLAGLWLGPAAGAASMALYVAAGAAGLPVFAPMGAPGILRLLGPTGGYLLAYPAAAAVAGVVARRFPRAPGRIAAAALGIAVIHAGGVAQLALLTGSASAAAALGSAPFVIGDALKAVIAGVIAPARPPRA
ncbi:MAG TPA: biotin transporter BioY [Gemmatimonadaceae bacterium]|nr:biotin transporter BioY [Gemmatimonadaceae bacterium]